MKKHYIYDSWHVGCWHREMVFHMKSVVIGGLAALLISIAAGAVLNSMNPTAADKFSTPNARVK